ncbi:MAG: glycosyltransferase [Candidatus Heimdallarchaeota archaeon]|nr:glycosyltransferase [Candidatus Heimdallarchaeota archaeon]
MSQFESYFQKSVQLMTFLIVGASGTLISLGLLYSLTEWFGIVYYLSSAIGYYIGISNNFVWNRKFTFEKTNDHIFNEYTKYVSSMLVGSIGYTAFLIFLTESFGIFYFYAAILSVGVSTVINFTLAKYWVFGKRKITIINEASEETSNISVKLVVSALNEENNITNFIHDLYTDLNPWIDLSLILMNNGSTDDTYNSMLKLKEKYPDQKITVITRDKILTYSKSYIEGFNLQNDLDFDYIGWVTSDNQISGETVSKILDITASANPELIKGMRVHKDYSLIRKIQSFFFNSIIALLFNMKVQDINGCPKLIKTELFEKLELKSDGWFLDAEVMLKLNKLIGEDKSVSVPIRFTQREEGKSKTNWYTAIELFMQIMKFRFTKTTNWYKA